MKAQIQRHEIIKGQATISIQTPYNASFVDALKAEIPATHRKWDSSSKTWNVSGQFEEKAREITRRFFEIEGEDNQVEYEEVRCLVKGGNSAKRTYSGGVTIDGIDIFSPMTGYLNHKSASFEIIESEGGFTSGDSRHAFDVEYTLKLKVRKGANWQEYGNANHNGRYEIL